MDRLYSANLDFVQFCGGISEDRTSCSEEVLAMCLDILPGKFSTEPEDFKQVTPILSAFFEWCEAEGVIKTSKILCDKLKTLDEKIYKKAKNPKNWGMAKSMFSCFVDL